MPRISHVYGVAHFGHAKARFQSANAMVEKKMPSPQAECTFTDKAPKMKSATMNESVATRSWLRGDMRFEEVAPVVDMMANDLLSGQP
jgi:hypothetical protein